MAELEPISIQQLVRASGNANALDVFVNADAATMVFRPAAEPIETLEYWRNYMSALTKGRDGVDGIDAAITSMTVTTGAAGTQASVVTGGTPTARTFALTIPRGDKGLDGSFTQKSYTTYAAMDADKVNIPANTSVTITNDTDTTKNGMYAYNGTAFTKSAYDPVALAATDATTKANNAKTQAVTDSKIYTDAELLKAVNKSSGTFDTLALLTASALVNDSYALVANDTDLTNNGHYKKVSGVWTKVVYNPEGSANAYVDEVLERTELITNLHTFTDNNGIAVASLGSDGSARFAGINGTLQDTVKYVPVNGAGNYTHIFADNDGNAALALQKDGLVVIPHAGVIQNAFAGNEVVTGLEYQAEGKENIARGYFDIAKFARRKPVRIIKRVFGFQDDVANIAGCRMPHPLALTATTGIFFFTQKHKNYTQGSENAQRLMVCDYTIDFDSEDIQVSEPRLIDQPPRWAEGLGVSTEPAAIRLTKGANAGRIFIIYRINEHSSQWQKAGYVEYNFYYRYSDDNGQTWSVRALTAQAGGAGSGVAGYGAAGHVIELESGRLILPVWRVDPRGVGSLISDDSGITWRYGAIIAISTGYSYSEVGAIQQANGHLLMHVRIDSDTGYVGRGIVRSTDDGETWVYAGLSTEPKFSNSNPAIMKTKGKLSGFPKVIAACSAYPAFYVRIKYRVRISYDDGETFPFEYAPFSDEQLTGYSLMDFSGDDTFLLGYETASSASGANPQGDINANNSVFLMVTNFAEVFKNVNHI